MFRAYIVPNKAGDHLETASTVAPMHLLGAVRLATEIGRSAVAAETPVGWSGNLRGAYGTTLQVRPKRIIGAVVNPVPYHDIREEGRKPGKMPPPAVLIPWVGSKLGVPPDERAEVAFLVARKIGKKGYKGAHMVEKGWKSARHQLAPILAKAGLKIVRAAHNGGPTA